VYANYLLALQTLRYARSAFNKDFLLELVSAGLSLEDGDGQAVIKHAVQCIGDNYRGNFQKSFHSIIALAGSSASSDTCQWIRGWFDNSGTEILIHEISAATSTSQAAAAASDSTQPGNAIGSLSLLVESGSLLRSLSYEENKFFILTRIVRWLALSSLCHFYVWMTSQSGCANLAEHVHTLAYTCLVKQRKEHRSCECSSQPPQTHALCRLAHHILEYMEGDACPDAVIPYDIARALIMAFQLPKALSIRTDLRTKVNKPDKRRLSRRRSEFCNIYRLLLEQLFVYPHVGRLLAHFGAKFGPAENPDQPSTAIEFEHLREHTIAVGGVCTHLQRAFGSTVILSLDCGDGWKRLISNPARFFFLNTKTSPVHAATHTVARALIKNEKLVMKQKTEFVDRILEEPVSNSELISHLPVSLIRQSFKLYSHFEHLPEKNSQKTTL
jgi:hypothetical protein